MQHPSTEDIAEQPTVISPSVVVASAIAAALTVTGVRRGFTWWSKTAFYALRKVKRASRELVQLAPVKPGTMMRNPELESLIRANIECRSVGVNIMDIPAGIGKTTATHNVLRDLQESDGSSAIVINCDHVALFMAERGIKNMNLGLSAFLMNQFQIPRDTTLSKSNVIGLFAGVDAPRMIICLDAVEYLFQSMDANDEEIKCFIKALANDVERAAVCTHVLLNIDTQDERYFSHVRSPYVKLINVIKELTPVVVALKTEGLG